MARRLTAYKRPKRQKPNGFQGRYYHAPTYAFLKKNGRYFLLMEALARGKIKVHTKTGRIYRLRNGKYVQAKLEPNHKGYLFLRIYAKVKYNNRYYYYRQAVAVQIVVYLCHYGLKDIPADMQVDHKDDKHYNNRADNLQLLDNAANSRKRWEKYRRELNITDNSDF